MAQTAVKKLKNKKNNEKMKTISKHCVKSARIWSYSGPYLPAFGLNMDQTNSEYGTFHAEKSTKKFNINKSRKLKII